MGIRGRRPKPTPLRLLQGNPGKRAIPDVPDLPTTSGLEPPDWLTGKAGEFWAAHAPSLQAAGLLPDVMREYFAAGCYYWSIFRTPREDYRARRDAYDRAVKVFKDFGMTPVDLARLGKQPKKDTPGSKWGNAL